MRSAAEGSSSEQEGFSLMRSCSPSSSSSAVVLLAVASLPYSICSFITPSSNVGHGSRAPSVLSRERRSVGAFAMQRPINRLGHRRYCRCSLCSNLYLRDTPPEAATFAGLEETVSKVGDVAGESNLPEEFLPGATVESNLSTEILSDADILRLPQVDGSVESLLATVAAKHEAEAQSGETEVAAVGKTEGGESVAEERLSNERARLPKMEEESEEDDPTMTGAQRRLKASVRETGKDSMKSFMKSMANHDLLNRNEERVLAKEIRKLMQWEEKRELLELHLLRPPTYAEWAAAVEEGLTVTDMKKQIRKSLRAKSALTESNFRLVLSIARKHLGRGVAMQDLCQEGIMSLNRAVEKFDPTRKSRFSSYATWWIKQGMMRAINGQSTDIRIPPHVKEQVSRLKRVERDLRFELGRDATATELAEKLNVKPKKIDKLHKAVIDIVSMELDLRSTKSKGSGAGSGGAKNSGSTKEFTLTDVLKDKGAVPENGAEHQMMKDDISRLICTLNPREQAVIRLRFGLDDGKAKTLEEIGNRFAVTRERIRQIEARALHKLRQPFRNYSVKCYTREL